MKPIHPIYVSGWLSIYLHEFTALCHLSLHFVKTRKKSMNEVLIFSDNCLDASKGGWLANVVQTHNFFQTRTPVLLERRPLDHWSGARFVVDPVLDVQHDTGVPPN